MRRTATLGWVAVAGLLGCRPTTPRGQIGEIDLTPRLPSGVAAPATPKGHEVDVQVCRDGEGTSPASLRVRWKTFEQGGIGYVASVAADLQASQGGLYVFLGKPKLVEAYDRAVVGVNLPVICLRMDLWGETRQHVAYVRLDAAGRHRTD